MITTLKALGLTWLTAWREAWANRGGFLVQIGVMAVNNLVWVVFWALFFRRIGTIRGWDAEQLMVLLAVTCTSVGIVAGLMSNSHQLNTLIRSGEIDAALALPVPTLPYLLCRRVNASHVGDLAFGPVLFAVLGNPTLARTAMFVFGVGCATLVIVGFLVLLGSLSFVAGRSDAGTLGAQMLLLFVTYPIDVFPGLVRFVLYVIVPAGFVAGAPVRIIDRPDPVWAAITLAAGLAFAFLGWRGFTSGLRRYTTGALWTDA